MDRFRSITARHTTSPVLFGQTLHNWSRFLAQTHATQRDGAKLGEQQPQAIALGTRVARQETQSHQVDDQAMDRAARQVIPARQLADRQFRFSRAETSQERCGPLERLDGVRRRRQLSSRAQGTSPRVYDVAVLRKPRF
jgi:hypothetical protein